MLSVGFVPFSTPSDKSFVYELSKSLSKNNSISIWSLNDHKAVEDNIYFGKNICNYKSHNRLLHRQSHNISTYKPHKNHSNLRNTLEINISIFWHSLFSIRRHINKFKPDVIHCTDNIGISLFFLRKFFPKIPITICKPTISVESSYFYRLYQKISFKCPSKVVTFTKCASEKIKYIAKDKNISYILPWGIDITKVKPISPLIVEKIRDRYALDDKSKLIVIANRFADKDLIRFTDFLANLKLKHIKFIVAVRPTRYDEIFKKRNCNNVLFEEGPKDFYDLLYAADIVLSPISEKNTSLLPLTWIESMIRGTPVITNFHPGVDEFIINETNGFVYESLDDLEVFLRELGTKNNLKKIGEESKKTILHYHDIDSISEKYLLLWKKLIKNIRV